MLRSARGGELGASAQRSGRGTQRACMDDGAPTTPQPRHLPPRNGPYTSRRVTASRRGCPSVAAFLVFPIRAVEVAVTYPGLRNRAAIVARELILILKVPKVEAACCLDGFVLCATGIVGRGLLFPCDVVVTGKRRSTGGRGKDGRQTLTGGSFEEACRLRLALRTALGLTVVLGREVLGEASLFLSALRLARLRKASDGRSGGRAAVVVASTPHQCEAPYRSQSADHDCTYRHFALWMFKRRESPSMSARHRLQTGSPLEACTLAQGLWHRKTARMKSVSLSRSEGARWALRTCAQRTPMVPPAVPEGD